MYHGGDYFMGGGFMWILGLALLIALVFVFRGMFDGSMNKSAESPLDILKKRYAKGEIDSEEFNKKRKELD